MDDSGFLVMMLFVCVVCGVLGGIIGAQKGQGGLGTFLGVLLGPLGVLIAAVLPQARR